MAASQMNVYVPAHQLRMRDGGSYLWVKWWKGDNTHYAHFHRDPHGCFLLFALGRNGRSVAEKEDADLDDLPDGLLEALQVRYDLGEYTEGDR